MNLGAPRVGVTRGSSLLSALPLVDGINRDQPGGPDLALMQSTLREGSNLGAGGPFDLEGSGFRANFKRKRNEHAPANHSIHSP